MPSKNLKRIIKNKQLNERNKSVAFEHVTFGYKEDTKTLDNISFEIYENEYVCVIGHNGSGKSTLSKLLTGLLQPQSGYIKLFDKAITRFNIKTLRDNIGIVFQNPDNQFIGLTVEDDIAFGLENRKVDPNLMGDIIAKVADMVHVKDLLKFDASQLSGGQKQRVAIASVLAINPKIIIFDESTAMLDPKSKNELKQLMLILKNNFNKTVISITHDMEEVVDADRVIILEKGKIVASGNPQDIFADQEFLQNIALDIPFTLKLSKLLHEQKFNINPTLQLTDLINQICHKK
ncbi:MAG: energy-coupling factor transporter ATPase [Mycoplasmataceae bacterium]|jgi:energy-coupling factor transport system ATP-binding protein|nr:energy-coupling factor transporter ATPase [Mycoplasmataceae bacterium]